MPLPTEHGTRCRMWIPPEDKDPVVLHAPTRKSVALFGAVNIRTGQLVCMTTPVFDADTFDAFLRMLLRHGRRSRLMTVVTDNARYHHAQSSRQFLVGIRERLRLDFLPPYSPDLNPIERVWKLLKRHATHNQYFPELDALLTAVTNQINIWSRPNAILKKLCGLVPSA
jgi:transposase